MPRPAVTKPCHAYVGPGFVQGLTVRARCGLPYADPLRIVICTQELQAISQMRC